MLASWAGMVAIVLTLATVGCSSSAETEPSGDGASSIAGAADEATSIGESDGAGSSSDPEAAAGSSTVAEDPSPDEVTAVSDPEVIASGGATGTTGNVRVTLGSTTLTNWPVNNIRSGEVPVEAGQTWAVVDVDLHVLSGAGLPSGFRRLDFSLRDASGEEVSAEAVVDHVGALATPNLQTRGSISLQLIFPVDASFDPAAAVLLVTEADSNQLPLLLPLEGPEYFENYPMVLPSGAEGSFVNEPFLGCAQTVEVDTVVERATIAINAVTESEIRSDVDRRLLTVALSMANMTENPTGIAVDALLCDDVSQWPDLELAVDGVSTASIREDWPKKIAPGSTSTVTATWDIPVAAATIELTAAGSLLGQWQADLPAAPAETGEPNARAAAAAAPAEIFQPPKDPSAVEVVEIGAGEATGSILGVEVAVGPSVSTSSSLATFLTDSPAADPEGRTWVFTTLTLSGEELWEPAVWNFALQDPNGRTYAVARAFDANGGAVTRLINAWDEPLTFAFETPGLVTETAGWSVSFQRDSSTPLSLPLSGVATDTGERLGLNGASEEITLGDNAVCSDGRMQATIIRAEFTLEGQSSGRPYRSPPGRQLATITVGLRNLSPADLGPAESAVCGALIFWPEFLLSADGRPVQSFDGLTDELEPGASGDYALVFEIPADTQVIELFGGARPTLIDSWELKEAAEVLEDFEARDAEPPPEAASPEDQFTVVTLSEEVLFAFGSATLQRDAIAPLNRVAQLLMTASEGDVFVVGHTDSIGDPAFNTELSEARALAVSEFLAAAEVDPDRLISSGAGESAPIEPNENEDGSDNPDGRAANRRVEILFTRIDS